MSRDDAPAIPESYLPEDFARRPEPEKKPGRRAARVRSKKPRNQFTIRTMIQLTCVLAVVLAFERAFPGSSVALVALSLAFLFTFGFGLAFIRTDFPRNVGMAFVAAAKRSGLPLSAGLRAYATAFGRFPGAGNSGKWHFVKLANELDAGVPLADAFSRFRGILPQSMKALFRVIESTSGSPAALTRMNDAYLTRMNAVLPLANMIQYYLIISLQFSLITNFLLVVIWPKFQAIVGDFGLVVSDANRAVIMLLQGPWTLHGDVWIYAAAIMPFLMIYLALLFRSGRGFGFVGRFVPWISTGERADVMRGLAETIRNGKPLDESMRIFADWSARRQVRRRCRLARQAMISGVDWIDALTGEGILRGSEAPLMRAAIAAGQPATALDRLADTIQARQWYRWRLFTEMANPVLTVICSGFVLLLCYGFFAPLVALIGGLV